MTPPHTRFKLSHNRLSRRSHHLLNRAEPQHFSMKTAISVQEDGLDSLDRTRSTSVDGLNKGPEEPEIDHIDSISSGSGHPSDEQATSTISSFEAGDLSVGSPRNVKEGHVARQNVLFTTSIIYETTIYMTPYQTDSTPPSTSKSPTLTSPATSSSPTTSHSTTSSANSSSQCGTLGLATGCSVPTTTPHTYTQQTPPIPSSYTSYPTPSTPSDATVTPISDTPVTISSTTMSLQPVLASSTVSNSTVTVSSPLPQSTSVPDTNSDPQLPSNIAAIVGGAIGAIVLLVLLIFIAIWYRNKRRLTVTPFTLPSTAAQTRSEVWRKSQGIGDAVRPSSRSPPSVQHSDACLMEHSGSRCPSFVADSVSSRLPDDDDAFASVIALHQQSHGLEKLYPSPSRVRTSDHYRHSSVESWIRQVVLEDCSREPSEVLPAYRSTKSLKSREGDDDHVVLPSAHPPLP
ncbi:hypothetical protein P692DRAFT_20849979 [Suillus brevipes Sb2]|nr:hypothetical protein P692DRAFT_20849979 [Suillus brevipes Sb2]